ncbi:acyl-CoA thioesterase [Niabella aquatica]
MGYIMQVQIRWSDLDVNAHVRHSVYYDWGAFCRIEFLREKGLPAIKMQELHIGPVIFREECLFRREIRQGDVVNIRLELTKARKDLSRFSIRHTIIKNEEVISAVINMDGAWMDTIKRKLCTPPPIVVAAHADMPRADDFEWQ